VATKSLLIGLGMAFALALVGPLAFSIGTKTVATSSALADISRGQHVFNRCRACHKLTDSTKTRLGPNLNNIFGRIAGSAKNFKYSKALQEAEFPWTEQRLDVWLTKPASYLPGNKMQFAGVRNAQDRKDLIAYLRSATLEIE